MLKIKATATFKLTWKEQKIIKGKKVCLDAIKPYPSESGYMVRVVGMMMTGCGMRPRRMWLDANYFKELYSLIPVDVMIARAGIGI